jgi:hypothetical protein
MDFISFANDIKIAAKLAVGVVNGDMRPIPSGRPSQHGRCPSGAAVGCSVDGQASFKIVGDKIGVVTKSAGNSVVPAAIGFVWEQHGIPSGSGIGTPIDLSF